MQATENLIAERGALPYGVRLFYSPYRIFQGSAKIIGFLLTEYIKTGYYTIIIHGGDTMTVFDFDNTIYDGESGFDFFLYYLKKYPKEVAKYTPKFAEAFFKYKTGKLTISEVINDYGYILKECCAKFDNIEEEISIFWDEHENKIKSFYDKIRKDDDVILSACPTVILKEICRRVGIKNFIGTEVDIETGDIHGICYREGKIKMFKEIYGDVEIDEFYTDSINDKPFMDIARDVYFVTGDRIEKFKYNGVYLRELK